MRPEETTRINEKEEKGKRKKKKAWAKNERRVTAHSWKKRKADFINSN